MRAFRAAAMASAQLGRFRSFTAGGRDFAYRPEDGVNEASEDPPLSPEEQFQRRVKQKRSRSNRKRFKGAAQAERTSGELVAPPQVPWLVVSDKPTIVEQAEAQYGPKETWASIENPDTRRELLGILVAYMVEAERESYRAQRQAHRFRRYAIDRHSFYARWVRAVADEPKMLYEWDVNALPFHPASQPDAARLGARAGGKLVPPSELGPGRKRTALPASSQDDVGQVSSRWAADGDALKPAVDAGEAAGAEGEEQAHADETFQAAGEDVAPAGARIASVEVGGAPFLRQRVREGRAGELDERVQREMRQRKMPTTADAQLDADERGGAAPSRAERRIAHHERVSAAMEAEDAQLAEAELLLSDTRKVENRKTSGERGVKKVTSKLKHFIGRTRTNFDAEGMYYRIQPDIKRPRNARPVLHRPEQAPDEVVKVDWKTIRALRKGPDERRQRARERFLRLVRGERPDSVPPLLD